MVQSVGLTIMKDALVFCIIAFTLFLFSPVLSQDKVELYNELAQIGALKQLNKTFDLQKGENLIVTVTPMRGKLSRVEIDVPESPFKFSSKKIRQIDRKKLTVDKSGTYTFRFINRSIFKKEVDIKIYKTRRTELRDTTILDDIIFTAFRDTIKKFKDDTIPIPDVAEYEFTLTPSFRYGSVHDSVIREPLIDNTKYQYAAYWVGVGKSSIEAYNKLKANPPPSWSLYGINEPIMAFGLGLTKFLPTSNSAVAKDVMFKFMNPDEEVPRLTRRDKKSLYFAVIPISSASKYKELILSFRNFNTTSPVPVYVKIVKFKLDRAYYNEYIIRERVQEIFKEQTIEVLAPLEE